MNIFKSRFPSLTFSDEQTGLQNQHPGALGKVQGPEELLRADSVLGLQIQLTSDINSFSFYTLGHDDFAFISLATIF